MSHTPTRHRLRTAALAIGAACALAHAAPATAAASTSTSTSTSSPLALGPLLNQVQTLVSGVPGTAQGVLCPVTQDVPGAGTAACNLDLLHLRWHAKLRKADGTTLEREIGALLNVPTLLDVDTDAMPDVVATVQVLSLDRVSLNVSRLLGENATLPLQLQAIVADPTRGSLPRQKIGFGLDARGSRLPSTYDSTVAFTPFAKELKVNLTNTSTGAGDDLKAVAGLFDGTPRQRQDEVLASMGIAGPVPHRFGGEVVAGKRMTSKLFASSTSTADLKLDAEYHDGPEHFVARATVHDLPTSMQADLVPGATPDGKQVTYKASARVPRIDGSFRATRDGVAEPLTAIIADVRDLPAGLTIDQTGPAAAQLTTDGKIGKVTFGLASGGEPQLMDPNNEQDFHYVNVERYPDRQSLAGRVEGLAGASFALGDEIRAAAKLDPKRVELRLREADRSANVAVRDAPEHVEVTFTPKDGRATYDGHGQEIERIDATMYQTAKPIFGRAYAAEVALVGLPPEVEVGFKPDGSTVRFDATDSIDLIEAALFTAGKDREHPKDGAQGVVYRNLPDRWSLGARIRDLRHVSLVQDPGGFKAGLEVQHAPFRATYEDETRKAHANVLDVPGRIDVDARLDEGKITYTARDAIDRIEVDAVKTDGTTWFKRAGLVHAALTGLPDELTVDLGADGEDGTKVVVTADEPVGAVELSAVEGEQLRLPPAGKSGITYVDTPDEWGLGARIQQLEQVRFATTPKGFQVGGTMGRQELGLDYADATTTLKGAIREVPGTVDVDLQLADGKVVYDASEPIEEIWAEAERPGQPFFDRADRVKARLTGLPQHVEVGFRPADGLRVTATPQVGAIEVAATDDAYVLPKDGDSGVVLRDTDEQYAVGARIQGLKEVTFAPVPGGHRLTTDMVAAPFSLDYADGEQTLVGRIADVPGKITLDVLPTQGKIGYQADQEIGEITLDVKRPGEPFFKTATRVAATLRGLPSTLDLGFKPVDGGPELTVSALPGQVGSMALSASDVLDGDAPMPKGDGNGIRYEDTDEHFLLAARLNGFKHLTFDEGETTIVDAEVARGRVDIDAQVGARTLTARLDQLPGKAKVTISPETGTYTYEAPEKITELFAEATSPEPFVDRIKKARVRLTGLPANTTVTTKPEGGGVKVETTQRVDAISASVSDGQDLVELDGPGAFLRRTKDDFRAAARVNGVRSVHVDGATLLAEVKADAGQRFTIDAAAEVPKPQAPPPHDPCEDEPRLCEPGPCEDDPTICEPCPTASGTLAPPICQPKLTAAASAEEPVETMVATVKGVIDQIPSEMKIERVQEEGKSDELTYTASAPIQKIELEGHDLPGDTIYYKPLHAYLRAEQVPSTFTVELPEADRMAVTTGGQGLGKVVAEVWHEGGRWGEAGLNRLRFHRDKVTRTLHAYAEVIGFNEFEADTGANKSFGVKFRSDDVKPILVRMEEWRTWLTANIQKPPREVSLAMPTHEDGSFTASYRASAPIPWLALEAMTPTGPKAYATIEDVPREMDVCFHAGLACDDPIDWYDPWRKLGFSFRTNPDAAPITVNGKLCSTVNAPPADAYYEEWSVQNCRKNGRKFLRLKDLRFRDVHFEMAARDGDEVSLFADTGPTGVGGEVLLHDPEFPVSHGIALDTGPGEFRFGRFGILLDTGNIPDIENVLPGSSFTCTTPDQLKFGLLQGFEHPGNRGPDQEYDPPNYLDPAGAISGLLRGICRPK